MNQKSNNEQLPAVIEADYEQEAEVFLCEVTGLDWVQVETLVMDEAHFRAECLFGARMAGLVLEMQAVEQNIATLDKRVKVIEQQKAKTPKRIQRPRSNTVNFLTNDEKPRWPAWDMAGFTLTLIALLSTLGIGFANVYSNLMASAEPVFLNNPMLAVFIALLMPVASIALKSLSLCCESERSKRRFSLSVFSLTALVLLGWTLAFAYQFTGVTAGIDFSQLDVSGNDHGSSVLVWLQLVSELLVSVSLALILEHILDKHTAKEWIDNPQYYQLSADLNPLKKKLSTLREQRSTLILQQLEAKHGAEAVLRAYKNGYTRLLSRHADQILD